MANEIKVLASLAVKNGNLDFKKNTGQLTFNQDAIGGPSPGTVEIGTSEESPAPTDITTLGWCFIRNLDTTNYVELGFSAGVYGIRLEPGEPALFRMNPSTTLFARANSAACKVEFYIFED